MLSLGIGDVVTSKLGRKTVAMMLAIVPGIGHIYLGATRRGIGILVTAIGLFLISYPGFTAFQIGTLMELEAITTTMAIILALVMAGLGAIGLWVWQFFDAKKIASQ